MPDRTAVSTAVIEALGTCPLDALLTPPGLDAGMPVCVDLRMISSTPKNRWRQAAVAALLCACTAFVSGDRATASPPDTLRELMDAHRCETIVRLEQVRSSKEAVGKPKKKDR